MIDESNAKSSNTTNTFDNLPFFAAFFWRSSNFSRASLLKSSYTNISGTNLEKYPLPASVPDMTRPNGSEFLL
ncbi:hypothetical protein AR158_c480L [Paramecium bursaria Chlorella virus AR158]|uniref:hypothetical protein n=1 Tax=Paramecium bursaria Chlorella virus AR158 TaxID=380598 RepID=UPI00015AA6FF|nr:hypothetical protein AR158_c480L [Paramecium bursaria Chlorella virus AR158]ABU44025.1 hypothetical protein AR158_c480L [Paramecium bursaria Chlorella virus AR158]